MAIFTYKGIDRTGKEVKGNLNCETEIVAKQKIKSMGIMLMSLKEKKAQAKNTSLLSNKRVSINDLSLMTRQLATLIKARIQIVEALQALGDQIDHEHLKVVLSDVKTKVNEGSSLAKALADHPKIFNNVYTNMVEAGEASGTLDIVLLRLAEFTESQVKLKNKIKSAMTYPVIISVFGFGMINVIFIVVIPQIAKMFSSSKKELPQLTKITIAISQFLQNYWYVVIIGIIATYFIVSRYLATTSGTRKWHRMQLRLPIVGSLIQMINVSRFCSTLGTLLNSGVPILTSMTIVKNLVGNVWMKDAIEESRIAVSEGSSITGPLLKSGFFPSLVTHMIKLGERSGELEPMLDIIAENYEDQVENKLSSLTSVIEPLMMIVMGFAVAIIIFSVIIPMMELNKLH
ncbi:MAG: type II secretion system inner membrane protein GspF [Halobacteriovoraceae bacterium]|nr:type II secretion system inner membrane protein GspF [Halobacteriovoraceae bacterium]